MSTKDQEWPREGEVVMCTVQNIEKFGAFVSLDEYGGKEGFIHISEVSTNWVKNIRNFFREGRKVVVKALRIDKSKQQVDLSLKRVTDQQRKYKVQQRKQMQKSNKLLEMAAENLGKTMEDSREEVRAKILENYPDLYSGFEDVIRSGKEILAEADIDEEWIEELLPIITSNVELPEVSISGEISLQIRGPRGVETLKQALETIGSPVDGNGKDKVNVKVIGPPKYKMTVTSEDYKTAEDIIQDKIDEAKEFLQPYEHSFDFTRKEK